MAKRGPRPFTPTPAQRRRVVHGIAAGLTREQIAAAIGVPLGTFKRIFSDEIRVGRTRAVLDTLDLLHEAAAGGNVAAMKEILRRAMPEDERPQAAEQEDTWDDVFEDSNPNLGQSRSFQ